MIDLSRVAALAWLAPLLLFFQQIRGALKALWRALLRQEQFEDADIGSLELWLRDPANAWTWPGYCKAWESFFLIVPGLSWSAPQAMRVMEAGSADGRMLFLVRRRRRPPVPVWLDMGARRITFVRGTFDTTFVFRDLGDARRSRALVDARTAAKGERTEWEGPGFRTVHLTAAGLLAEAFKTGGRGDAPYGSAKAPQLVTTGSPGAPGSGQVRPQCERFSWVHEWWASMPAVYDDSDKVREVFRDVDDSDGSGGRDYYVHDDNTLRVRDQFLRWAQSGRWFRSRRIPWRRGFALHGPPRTGKSMLVAWLALRYSCPLFILDLNGASNEVFVEVRRRLEGERKPVILLLEDFDNCFHGRTNVMTAPGAREMMTFDAVLQFLGGAQPLDGVCVFVTTNYLDRLDPALLGPGRIDSTVFVGPMDRERARRLVAGVLSDAPEAVEPLLDSLEFPVPAAAVVNAAVVEAWRLWLGRER